VRWPSPDPTIPATRGMLRWGGRVVSEPSFVSGSRRDAGLRHSWCSSIPTTSGVPKGEISLRLDGCMVSHDDH
jgi:hypothetical protein